MLPGAEGVVGNRSMTVRIDGRGSTYDINFPTVGLHSYVRPREGDLPQSRCHFRAIVGRSGRRLDGSTGSRNARPGTFEYQQYQGATNLLTTKLTWRFGPIQVLINDFVAMGDCLPLNAGREKSPGQYIKRFFIKNEGNEVATPRSPLSFKPKSMVVSVTSVLVGTMLTRSLLAINRGHAHSNRKLARDSTVEFAVALDDARGSRV